MGLHIAVATLIFSAAAIDYSQILGAGENAAAVVVPLDGGEKALKDIAPGKRVLLLFILDPKENEYAATLLHADAMKALSETEAEVVLVRPSADFVLPEDLPASVRIATDSAFALAHRFGFVVMDWPEGIGLKWIEPDGRIALGGVWPAVTPDILPGMIQKYKRGKTLYQGQCTRCHGDDGAATNYPAIKTLNGIGQRMTLPEIAQATKDNGFVSLDGYKDQDIEALIQYVAGL